MTVKQPLQVHMDAVGQYVRRTEDLTQMLHTALKVLETDADKPAAVAWVRRSMASALGFWHRETGTPLPESPAEGTKPKDESFPVKTAP